MNILKGCVHHNRAKKTMEPSDIWYNNIPHHLVVKYCPVHLKSKYVYYKHTECIQCSLKNVHLNWFRTFWLNKHSNNKTSVLNFVYSNIFIQGNSQLISIQMVNMDSWDKLKHSSLITGACLFFIDIHITFLVTFQPWCY